MLSGIVLYRMGRPRTVKFGLDVAPDVAGLCDVRALHDAPHAAVAPTRTHASTPSLRGDAPSDSSV